MPEADLDLLIDAAREAGDLALSFHGPDTKRWEKPGDEGPVTEADLAVNRLLEDRLRTARPDYGWLSEESEDDPDRTARARVFVIDPIDGTRSFAAGESTWAHSLAVVENGIAVAGVVYLPRRGLLFSAATGAGTYLNGERLKVRHPASLDAAEILATKPNMKPEFWAGGHVPAFRRTHRPSLAYRTALVAQGRYDAMVTFRKSWEWDVAAGDLIMREAGARVTDRRGAALRFNNPVPQVDGIVAGGTRVHDALMAAMA